MVHLVPSSRSTVTDRHEIFDFTEPKVISERIGNDDEQPNICAGYDHTFELTPGARCL